MLSFIRHIIFALWFIVTSVPITILCLIRPFNPENLYIYACLWSPLAMKIMGVKVNLIDHHIMEENRPSVVIMNHQCNYDIILGGAIRMRNLVSLGKFEVLKIPFFGLFYWLSGNILIKREKKSKAMKAMQQVTKTILEKKLSVLIMPEGTRSQGKGLGKFKRGAFRTAISAQVPIVSICASSWHKNINLNKWNAGTINVKFLPPVTTKGLTTSDTQDLANKCEVIMREQLDLLV